MNEHFRAARIVSLAAYREDQPIKPPHPTPEGVVVRLFPDAGPESIVQGTDGERADDWR